MVTSIFPEKIRKGGCGLKWLGERCSWDGMKSNFPSAHRCWALKQCSVRWTQTALHCRGEAAFFKKLIEKEFGSHRRSAELSCFRSTLAYFICVQTDIADASQLWTLKEDEWLLLQLAQGLKEPQNPILDLPRELRTCPGSPERLLAPSRGCEIQPHQAVWKQSWLEKH